MPNSTNSNRTIPSYALHIRHNHRIQLCSPHLPRRQLRLTPSLSTRQRSIHILYLPLPSCRTRTLLRVLPIFRNMKRRHPSPLCSHSHSIHRLRIALRTNILLRSHSHYQPSLRHPLYWHRPRPMNLRWFLRRQGYPNPILRLPLPPTISSNSLSNSPPSILTRNRIQQPHGYPIRP